MILGILGNVRFSVSSSKVFTLKDISVSHTSRIAKHDILGKKPKLEYMGEDLDSISFNIRLDGTLGINPKKELDNLKALRGMVCGLSLGQEYFGQYLLESISNDIKYTYANGDILVAELSISLSEYINDN